MKKKSLLCVLLIAIMLSLATVACGTTPEIPTDLPGTGTYYYDDAVDGEYFINLNNGNSFAFSLMGENKSGTYKLDNTALTLTFDEVKGKPKDATINAKLENEVITLSFQTLNNVQFLKKNCIAIL